MRNESINVGVLFYSEQEHSAKFKIIPDSSFKIRGLAINNYQKDLFQTTMKYLKFSSIVKSSATLRIYS